LASDNLRVPVMVAKVRKDANTRTRYLVVLACVALLWALMLPVARAQESSGAALDDPAAESVSELTEEAAPTPVPPLATPTPAPTSTPTLLSAADVASVASASLVQVLTADGSAGSGVRIAEGIITNEHVVRNFETVQVIAVDGRKANGKVVSTDHDADLALVVSDLDIPPLALESATLSRQGDELLVLGYPRPYVIVGQPTLTRGLLSALRRDPDGRLWVQTDAPLNHRNSGGPVLNMRGHLIAVVSFGIRDAQSLNFAVASDTIEAFLKVPRTLRPVPTPTAIPTPTQTPLQRDCAAAIEVLPLINSTVDSATRAQAGNDYSRLRGLASDLRTRKYPTHILPSVNALLRVLDWSSGSAEIRANWPLLLLTASRTPGGELLIAAAQTDLNNDDAQARVALIDFEAALRQFGSECGIKTADALQAA
jgi:S1-C subfamily serine protease